MKLLLSILDDRSAGRVAQALVARRYGVTRMNTVGGFLRRGNVTLLVGVDDAEVDQALAVMRGAYLPVGASGAEAPLGPVFVLAVAEATRV